MSQDLYDFLRQRARMKGPKWPAGLSVSLIFHGLLAAAILVTPKTEAKQEEPKVIWVRLPSSGDSGPLGGASPMEQGTQGERQRRVEEVAPQRPEPAGPAVTPNAFGTKKSQALKGTSTNPNSLGKAPVAAKGKAPVANPVVGAAGQGAGGGIGVGASIPGLKASNGIQGGSGLISDLDGNFPFIWYLQQIQSRITGNWNRLSSVQGRVQIYFRIKRDGTIDGARVESPSGNASLDQSALLAVRRSDPLPRLPEGFDSGSLGVRFWFSYLGN
ncbi:MAG: TonB family protein [Holophaga sp.]|nr:TonB family protein [Holophaga sp.]